MAKKMKEEFKGYPGLWSRIVEAFGTDEISKIAEIMELTYQSVYRWQKDEVLGLKTLEQVSNKTGFSVHWLLKGEGAMKIRHLNSEEQKHKKLLETMKDQLIDKTAPHETVVLNLPRRIAEEIKVVAKEDGVDFEEEATSFLIQRLIDMGRMNPVLKGLKVVYYSDYIPKTTHVNLTGDINSEENNHTGLEEGIAIEVIGELSRLKEKTLVFRAKGNSMSVYGIYDGDLIVGYKPADMRSKQIVLARVDGKQTTLKYLWIQDNKKYLLPLNPLDTNAQVVEDPETILCVVLGTQGSFQVEADKLTSRPNITKQLPAL